jgi:hypothetical protein
MDLDTKIALDFSETRSMALESLASEFLKANPSLSAEDCTLCIQQDGKIQRIWIEPRQGCAPKTNGIDWKAEAERYKHAYETAVHDDCSCPVNKDGRITAHCIVHGDKE